MNIISLLFIGLTLYTKYVDAIFNITCIVVAAPKKIPMLTYTIDYFLNAYNYNHEGINIEEFYLVKGTEHPFPEMDECAKKMRDNGINVNNDIYEYEWKEGTKTYKNFVNYITRFRAEYSENFWKDQSFSSMIKDSVINYYNYQVIEKIKQSQGDYPDYLLFVEDDVAMKKTWFIELRKMLFIKDPTESSLKICYLKQHKPVLQEYFTSKNSCAWGFWGVLLNKEQMRNWDRLSHFLPYGYCGDQFHCMMVWWFDKRIRMKELWYHFGRDKNIKPRIRKYWN